MNEGGGWIQHLILAVASMVLLAGVGARAQGRGDRGEPLSTEVICQAELSNIEVEKAFLCQSSSSKSVCVGVGKSLARGSAAIVVRPIGETVAPNSSLMVQDESASGRCGMTSRNCSVVLVSDHDVAVSQLRYEASAEEGVIERGFTLDFRTGEGDITFHSSNDQRGDKLSGCVRL